MISQLSPGEHFHVSSISLQFRPQSHHRWMQALLLSANGAISSAQLTPIVTANSHPHTWMPFGKLCLKLN